MEKRLSRAASVQYWDENAKWYKLWVEHNAYHNRLIEILTSLAKPGWKVLDIGAGGGILSLPLAAMGCRVTTLEPSAGMRTLLEQEAAKRGIMSFMIEPRSWENVPLSEVRVFDLIVASNSLHLTEFGFASALEKVFLAKPLHAFIISEKQFLDISHDSDCHGYSRCFAEHYSVESSYAYHCVGDAFEHWSFKHERQPDPAEMHAIISELSYENGHLWRKGSATVCMYCWSRCCAAMNSYLPLKEVLNAY
ncbi:MAG: methyltransferase domain-containing protein [Nitrospira sp.]|nr:methyltransferase domain-containing protein [Nitrospira sp.]